MEDDKKQTIMDHPFPKAVSLNDKVKKLQEVVSPEDSLAVLINADPDSIASAMALKRFFWRKVKKTSIYRINVINRADNLAMIKLLKMEHKHVRAIDGSKVSKWAILDSQPHHNEQLSKYRFDIIIDHHPVDPGSEAQFVDIQEDYGATSSMLTEYLRTAGIKPSPRLATALFYGIKTDTDNFVRDSTPHDINAFRYLYQFVNINIIKKIESSEMTKKTLNSFRTAMDNLTFIKDMAFIHMGKVDNTDVLVVMADFFLKMAEAKWSFVSGVCGQKLIIIIRNARFRLDAGKMAQRLFGPYGSAGGHQSAARAEIQLDKITEAMDGKPEYSRFVIDKLKKHGFKG
ncbi:bifunctional oligoribonuclease/PAP phosphatase NrnA [Thermodesulfobacteriota bacterium]